MSGRRGPWCSGSPRTAPPRARDFLAALGAEGVTSLLVEGGARTAGWLVSEGAVDRYVLFVAPLLLGKGVRAVSGWASRSPTEGKRLAFTSVRRVGPDIEITAEERRCSPVS
ncbi:MAG: dihydrofolate reductase family protein [Deltaproteobacteria bacterium]|nr:dihydrofolate reductase family protein [Deltaproteobacteria bacterium]